MQKGFTLLELLVTTSITALMMLAISSLFISFLATAYKSRISQSLRESGGNAMHQMIEMIRSANEISSVCASSPTTSLILVGEDGLETTLQEDNNHIASVSATRTTYLTEDNSLGQDAVQDLTFTCYPTQEGKKYIEISFTLKVGDGEASNSARSTSLDFGSGVATRN